eukprot:2200978-Rhodomonas_salina.2
MLWVPAVLNSRCTNVFSSSDSIEAISPCMALHYASAASQLDDELQLTLKHLLDPSIALLYSKFWNYYSTQHSGHEKWPSMLALLPLYTVRQYQKKGEAGGAGFPTSVPGHAQPE